MIKNRYILPAALCAAIAIISVAAILIVLNKSDNEKNKEEKAIMVQTENENINLNSNYEGQPVGIVTPPEKPAYYDALVEALRDEFGAAVQEIAWADMSGYLAAAQNSTVILPEAASIPSGASEAIDKYLKNGGKLLTLGGPPLSQVLHQSGDKWLAFVELAKQTGGRYMLFDFERESDGKRWDRNTDKPKNGQSVEMGDFDSPAGGDCLHVVLDSVSGWDTIAKNIKIPEGNNAICLYAKGGPNTGSLSIELIERDSSRWYAVFPVTQDWRHIVLTDADFAYWHDNASVGRGGSGDKVNFAQVGRFAIGCAFSGITPGENEYWFDEVSVIESDFAAEQNLAIDGLSPEWKFYPVTNGAKAIAFDNQIFVAEREYILPENSQKYPLFSPSPRPQATGYKRQKEKRFVPLIEIYDEKNLRSGFLAWMFVNSGAGKTGYAYDFSIIAGFGTSDPAFYNADGIAAVTDVAKAMLEEAMFVEAGATEYIYVKSETKTLPFGAYVRGKTAEGLSLEIELDKDGAQIYKNEYGISEITGIKSKNELKIFGREANYDLSSGEPDTITAILKKNGRIIDKISHEIVFWSPKPESERKYITAKDNEFLRDGKPLRLYGVNYMPSSGIAVNAENGAYFEYYVSSQSYDPDVFCKDLLRVKEVGFNSVSVFVYHHTAMETKNMLHLIDMCDKLGLVVDLSIRPHADPFNLNEMEVVEIIGALHVAELDNVVAYDIAWERYFGTYEGSYGNPHGRKAYDENWRVWIADNYGSLENAEAEWGCKAPAISGKTVGPSDDMLRGDGAHTKMVAAYRRFVDELVSAKHCYVKDLIMGCDPNHLVSARTGAQGGLPLADPGDMGYDYLALAEALDFMSPESYVINSDFNTADQGIFTNAYSRYCKPGAPVMWKEFGQHIWNGSNFNDTTKAQEIQADYYRRLYEMMISGHTGAAYCWFWAGGYRANENSDYGITNPDGSDRLVTKIIRDYREPFMNQPEFGEPDIFFEIDRDMSATGILGIYESIKDDFFSAVKQGKTVALKNR